MRELFALYVAAMTRPASHDDVLLRMLTRPQWAFHSELVPLDADFIAPETAVEASDIELCKRLITAFHTASELPSQDLGPIWSGVADRAYKRMVESMSSPESLAQFLSTMFRSEAVEGLSTGQSYPNAMQEEGRRVWLMKLLDGMVSVAEMLGCARVENFEQTPTAYGLRRGIGYLVSTIEAALGISISFPNVGSSYGFVIEGELITMESPEHLEVASRVVSMGRSSFIEIGGGFGGTAYWILRLLSPASCRYRIYDLPYANVLQGYFLSKVLPVGSVSLYGEPDAGLQVLPAQTVFDSPPADILINENSIPEMPSEIALAYLRWASANVKVFYSYNQECGMPVGDFRQNIVHDLTGGFKRISRSPAWVRKGYVEEVYRTEK